MFNLLIHFLLIPLYQSVDHLSYHAETPGDWSHIIKQIGMFTFTGLNSDQVAFMRQEYHIYMTSDGRISMAGLSSRTVPHLADAIHAAVTKLK